MSYDIFIRSNNQYSEQADFVAVKAFIASLPGIRSRGGYGFAYGDEQESWMEIDLELIEVVDGEPTEAVEVEDKINCVACLIPYGFWDRSKAANYFAVCSRIAKHLSWQAVDVQTDKLI